MLHDSVYRRDLQFKIVGTLGEGTMPTMLLFRRDYLKESVGQTGGINFFWVRVDREESIPGVIKAIDGEFANSGDPTHTESEGAFQAGFLASMRTLITLAEVLAAIVLVSIALVAANTAAMSVRERRGELAVMRSIGFPGARVIGLLAGEGALIGLAGGASGIGMAYATMKLLPLSTDAFGPIGTIAMPVSVPIAAVAAALLIGTLSALVPASIAARRNIVDELRAIA